MAVSDVFPTFETLKTFCDDGKLNEAVQAVAVMNERRAYVSINTLYCLLEGCIKAKDLALGREVHRLVIQSGLGSNSFLATHLIRMFALCKSLTEACKVFLCLPKPNKFAWSAIISAHVNLGKGEQAILQYHQMHKYSVQPDGHIFVAGLKACASTTELSQGRLIHTHVIGSGFESNGCVRNALLDMYAKTGSLEDAHTVFNSLFARDIVTWNSMIAGYVQHGNIEEALHLFQEMRQEGLDCNSVTWNTMIAGHVQHGHCDEAFELFQQMQQLGMQPNNLTWNSMISGYAQHKSAHAAIQLFIQMQMEGMESDTVTFVNVLKACSSISGACQCKIVHVQIIANGFASDLFVGNALIHMYAKCKNLKNALRVFNNLPHRDLVSWNALISGYADDGHFQEVFQLFQRMKCEGLSPNQVTFVSSLKACSCVASLDQGRLIHAHIIESDFESDVFAGTAIINMYMKCMSPDDAQSVFNKLPMHEIVTWSTVIAGHACNGYIHKCFQLLQEMQEEGIKPSIVTWNGLIAGFVYCGGFDEALQIFQQMQDEAMEPNEASIVSILKACSGTGDLGGGRFIHTCIIQQGWETEVHIGSTLINMYAKCGSLIDANGVFMNFTRGDVVVLSAMIGAYAQYGHCQKALQLFHRILGENMLPNQVTFVCILKACLSGSALHQGKLIHALILESGVQSNIFIGNSLIDMYAKCGCLQDANVVFCNLLNRNAVTWSAMIELYAKHGDYKSALDYFQRMQQEGFMPNDVTFLSLLSACSRSGHIKDGCFHFNSMWKNHCIMPMVDHYGCMVDLLGRAGCLIEAEDLLQTLPYQPNFVCHMSLLSNSKMYGNLGTGERYFDCIFDLHSRYSAVYGLMLEIYAQTGQCEHFRRLKEIRKCANAWKKPGISSIEFHNMVHDFIVQDKHVELYAALKKLHVQMEEEGHVPWLDLVQ